MCLVETFCAVDDFCQYFGSRWKCFQQSRLRKNMKNRLMPLADKLLLRKRSIIEIVNDQLKNISQIEHSRHRSFTNFLVNLASGFVAYCFQPKKPSLHIHPMLPATTH